MQRWQNIVVTCTVLGFLQAGVVTPAWGQAARPAPAAAQTPAAGPPGADAVALKHGGEVRGSLTEVALGDHVSLQMANGQIATVRWDEIAAITRNGVPVTFAAPGAPPPPAAGMPGAPAPYPGPKTLPYREPVPAGYHLETKPRLGLLITGSILTAIGALGLVAINVSDGNRQDKALGSVVVGVLFLGPGLPLLLTGLLSQKKLLVRDDAEARRAPLMVGAAPLPGGGVLSLGKAF